ncbi:MAG TPA: shikimate kinase AroK [Gammaproteobacteria bacterium]|nr:shikimate kinase AroK [Gammaproteobacteria bacterium]
MRYARIFLIGPMGAGKSAIGRELAQLLKREFLDADREIERRTGVDIPLIFEKEGEAGFRRREREIIAELTQRDNVVLATGGGVVLDAANREHLSSRGFIIYLKASLEALSSRTGRNQNRPLLATDRDHETRLRELFAAREPYYKALAQLTIATDHGHVRALARQIARELEHGAAPVQHAG